MDNQQNEIITYKETWELSNIFIQSGLFPDVKSQAQAAVKILAGKELGLSPFQSMRSIYFVNGRSALMADVKAYLLKQSKKYDYEIEKLDETECVLKFFKIDKDKREEIGISVFTFKDAAKAGLVNKDVWKAYPRNMLFSRALSNGVSWYCPDAINGYSTLEEIATIPEPKPDLIEITKIGEVTSNGEKTI